MRVIKPPAPIDPRDGENVLFLAGSIEMGKAEDWQSTLTSALASRDGVILNPRRDAWDSTWRQSIEDTRFREQVVWELDGLDRATAIAVWFSPDTKSPVTLLELGLHVRSGRLVVGCPDGFWRKGNIEVVCDRFGTPLCHDWTSFIVAVERKLGARAPNEGCWCAALGKKQRVFEKGTDRRPLLEIIRGFTLVRECSHAENAELRLEHRRSRAIHRCSCGSLFVYEWDYEYLANGTEDEEWLERIDEARAAQLP